jgi:hypothetical protein
MLVSLVHLLIRRPGEASGRGSTAARPPHYTARQRAGHFGWKAGGVFIIIEVVACGVSYLQWSLMNKDQNYRYDMTQSWWGRHAVEVYYVLGERMDEENKTREEDLKTWRLQGRSIAP